MPLKAAVRFRLRDGSTFEKALPLAGEVRMEHVSPEIRQLAKLVTDHAISPWLELDDGSLILLEAVVAIEPVETV